MYAAFGSFGHMLEKKRAPHAGARSSIEAADRHNELIVAEELFGKRSNMNSLNG